jgi:hypothetical protein
MKKMKTVFVIDHNNEALATNHIRPENAWVFEEKNVVATIKFDGTAAFFENGQLYKRWNRKLNKQFIRKAKKLKENFIPEDWMFKDIPEGSIACENQPDKITMHYPYWIPVGNGNEDLMFREALKEASGNMENGVSYELIGPKIQGNPHDIDKHILVKHGGNVIKNMEMSYDGIYNWMRKNNAEGIVFHGKDGKKSKIRRKDMFDFKVLTNGRKIDWRDKNILF